MMQRKLLALALAGMALLSGLLWWKKQTPNSSSQEPAQGKSRIALDASKVATNERRIDASRDVARSELRTTLQQELPARTPGLLKSLEELQRLPFDHEMRSVYQSIIDQGDFTECHAAISLLEQREERDSVRFLASLLRHPDEEIRHRAWMACEAIAGQTMKGEEEISAWAESWNPDPAMQELMNSQQETTVPSAPVPHPSQRKITDREKAPIGEWKPQFSPKAKE